MSEDANTQRTAAAETDDVSAAGRAGEAAGSAEQAPATGPAPAAPDEPAAPAAEAQDAPNLSAERADAAASEPEAAPEAAEAAPGAAPEAPSDQPDKAGEYLALARRTQADFDNYRKRMARENAAAADRGAGRLAKELLPALDHLDLALNSAAGEGGHEDVVRGFAMVRDELLTALGRVGIEAFSPKGEPFDPSQHEAMAQQPAEDAASGTVIEVYQQGYRINGTVLRPARVIVAQ